MPEMYLQNKDVNEYDNLLKPYSFNITCGLEDYYIFDILTCHAPSKVINAMHF